MAIYALRYNKITGDLIRRNSRKCFEAITVKFAERGVESHNYTLQHVSNKRRSRPSDSREHRLSISKRQLVSSKLFIGTESVQLQLHAAWVFVVRQKFRLPWSTESEHRCPQVQRVLDRVVGRYCCVYTTVHQSVSVSVCRYYCCRLWKRWQWMSMQSTTWQTRRLVALDRTHDRSPRDLPVKHQTRFRTYSYLTEFSNNYNQ